MDWQKMGNHEFHWLFTFEIIIITNFPSLSSNYTVLPEEILEHEEKVLFLSTDGIGRNGNLSDVSSQVAGGA